MSVDLREGVIHLTGPCRVEDAEALVTFLLDDRARGVDLAKCTLLHAAVLQVFLAFRPRIVVPASDPLIYGLLSNVLDESAISSNGG